MKLAYPIILKRDHHGYIVSFPDIPEALTIAKKINTALERAEDALIVALSGYLDQHLDIPLPRKPYAGQHTIMLPPTLAIKLSIYQTMRDQGVSQVTLAERLQCDTRQVRRLLDLDQHSRMDLLDQALNALGKQMIVSIKTMKPIEAKDFSRVKER